MASVSERYSAFRALAKEYCSTIENSDVHGLDGLRTLRDDLLALYSCATKLPDAGYTSSDGDKDLDPIAHDEWCSIYASVRGRMPFDLYWDAFNPLIEPSEGLIAGSLADDLADIWRDLKSGLIALDSSTEIAPEAIWWE